MNTTKRTRVAIAVLVAAALAPVAPAAADVYAPFSDGPEATQREGSESIVLRRDGDRSAPFVADVSPEASPAATSPGDDAFDWGDAAIGAGASLLVVALVASGAGAVAGRRRQSPTPASAAS
jgi:hypothetical protein